MTVITMQILLKCYEPSSCPEIVFKLTKSCSQGCQDNIYDYNL